MTKLKMNQIALLILSLFFAYGSFAAFNGIRKGGIVDGVIFGVLSILFFGVAVYPMIRQPKSYKQLKRMAGNHSTPLSIKDADRKSFHKQFSFPMNMSKESWTSCKNRIIAILNSSAFDKREQIESLLFTLPLGPNHEILDMEKYSISYCSCGYPRWIQSKKYKQEGWRIYDLLDGTLEDAYGDTDWRCPFCVFNKVQGNQ